MNWTSLQTNLIDINYWVFYTLFLLICFHLSSWYLHRKMHDSSLDILYLDPSLTNLVVPFCLTFLDTGKQPLIFWYFFHGWWLWALWLRMRQRQAWIASTLGQVRPHWYLRDRYQISLWTLIFRLDDIQNHIQAFHGLD